MAAIADCSGGEVDILQCITEAVGELEYFNLSIIHAFNPIKKTTKNFEYIHK